MTNGCAIGLQAFHHEIVLAEKRFSGEDADAATGHGQEAPVWFVSPAAFRNDDAPWRRKQHSIVSRDPHLLELEKPFGVEMITPRTLLNRLGAIP